jgi:hypothetical protein
MENHDNDSTSPKKLIAFLVGFEDFAGKPACVIKATDEDYFILVALTHGELTIERKNRIARLAQALAVACTGGVPMEISHDPKDAS